MVMTDDEDTLLYNSIKDDPEFENLPIPSHWFKKFNIPPRNPVSVKEYIESNYAMMMSLQKKPLPPLIISEPQQNGKLVQLVEVEPIPVETIVRPYEHDPNAYELPFIRESATGLAPVEQSHPQTADVSGQDEPECKQSQVETDGTEGQ